MSAEPAGGLPFVLPPGDEELRVLDGGVLDARTLVVRQHRSPNPLSEAAAPREPAATHT